MKEHYNIRFLSDFSDAAGLNQLDPNLLGMIDTIVASRGRLFVGTWFSTFTGYIVSGLLRRIPTFQNTQQQELTHSLFSTEPDERLLWHAWQYLLLQPTRTEVQHAQMGNPIDSANSS